jgi:hypothetical protein
VLAHVALSCLLVAHDALRYWVLTDGRAVNWSVQELASKKLDELVVDAAAQEAYFAVGDQMGLTPLGMMEDVESEA